MKEGGRRGTAEHAREQGSVEMPLKIETVEAVHVKIIRVHVGAKMLTT